MIGIFDSGVGGMTVARAVEQLLPDYPQIYFGDLARAPYGPKSRERIIQYSLDNTRFLLEHGAKLIIIACNSAASVATDILVREFPVPFFEVITPAVRQAVTVSDAGRIGVIGTLATIRSGIYEKKILDAAPGCRVVSSPCPLLVPLVEEGWLEGRETKMIIRRYLQPLKSRQVDTLVLGCTHYPLLRDLIQPRIGRRVKVIDSSAVAEELRSYLDANPQMAEQLYNKGSSRYYVSDVTDAARETAARIFDRPIDLVRVDGHG
jgi:glutamate racemase